MDEPDGHNEQQGEVEPDFGQRDTHSVDPAAAGEVVDLEGHEENHEDDRRGVGQAAREVVSRSPQHHSGGCEGHGGDAIAVEQPVDDRCPAEVAADHVTLDDGSHFTTTALAPGVGPQ